MPERFFSPALAIQMLRNGCNVTLSPRSIGKRKEIGFPVLRS
jgi:hypothetical protein